MGVRGVAIDEHRYGRLLAKALPAVIKNDAENEHVLEQIEALINKGEKRIPEEDRLLELMAKLVENFEAEAYPIERKASPNEMLAYMIEQRGMKQAELLPVLGCSRSFLSEMVNGHRNISIATAKKLSAFFHKPVDLFL